MLNQYFFKYGVYYPVVFLRGELVPQYLKKLLESQSMDSEQLKKLQLEKLNALLVYAKENVPYYQDTLPKTRLGSLQEIKNIPLIDKSILRNKQLQLTADRVARGATKKTSGGSTGAPVTLLKSKNAMAQELAAQWRGFSWAGVEIGDKQGRFWGVPNGQKERRRAKLIDFVCNRYRCSAFSFNEQNLEKYLQHLKHFKPKYFYGYVSMLVQLASFVKEKEFDIPYKLECIITTAEVLSKKDRNLLEQVFGCKVYNEYGCGEIGTIAHECESGNLHINSENIIVEILGDDGKPVRSGEIGEIVVTELNNFEMPLIRYRLADYGKLATSSCDCGRELKILKEVTGREYDFLINSKGVKFHGEFFLYIIEDIKKMGGSVNGVQFVQDDVKMITVNIVPGLNYEKRFNDILIGRIHKGFDADILVNVVYMEHIQREKSGKLRVVKRNFQFA